MAAFGVDKGYVLFRGASPRSCMVGVELLEWYCCIMLGEGMFEEYGLLRPSNKEASETALPEVGYEDRLCLIPGAIGEGPEALRTCLNRLGAER